MLTFVFLLARLLSRSETELQLLWLPDTVAYNWPYHQVAAVRNTRKLCYAAGAEHSQICEGRILLVPPPFQLLFPPLQQFVDFRQLRIPKELEEASEAVPKPRNSFLKEAPASV